MGTQLDVGHARGNAHGPHLYNAAGQIVYSTADGATAVLTGPTVANQPMVASSGLVPSWGSPQSAAAVAADVTHTQSNTTLSDITALLVPIGASATEIWFFEAFLLISTTSSAVDIKFGWTVPTSATMKWGSLSAGAAIAAWTIQGGVASSPSALAVQTDTIVSPSANGLLGMSFAGMIFGGGTAGNVQMQFAQNTSTAVDLIVQKGSMLRYRRLVA